MAPILAQRGASGVGVNKVQFELWVNFVECLGKR